MSQLLARLDALLAGELEPGYRGELLARRACYVARTGDFESAREQVARLRAEFPSGTQPKVSILVMLAEGLIHTMERVSPEGLDRIRRAQLLAVSLRDKPLTALTSAWLAHWQSECSQFKGMVRSVELALESAVSSDPQDSEALARASMVAANSFQSLGDRVGSSVWYASVRHHAVVAGDQATTEAMIYNRAAFAVGFVRARACLQPVETTHLKTVMAEIATARNYQQLVGVNVLTNLDQLWIARMLLLQGRFSEAVEALRTVRGLSPFSEKSFDRSFIDLEVAYCQARLGFIDAALATVPHENEHFEGLHRDEQLVAAWLRHELVTKDSRFGSRLDASTTLNQAREAYLSEQTDLAKLLEPLRSLTPPGVPTAVVEAETRRAQQQGHSP